MLARLGSAHGAKSVAAATNDFAVDIPAGTTFVVIYAHTYQRRFTSVSVDGAAATFVAQNYRDGTDQPLVAGKPNVEIWTFSAPTTGAGRTLELVLPSAQFCAFTCHFFSGEDSITPLGTPVLDAGASGTAAALTVSSAAGEIVVGGLTIQNGNTTAITANGDNTADPAAFLFASSVAAGSYAPGAASVLMSWDRTAASGFGYSQMAVAVKPAISTAPDAAPTGVSAAVAGAERATVQHTDASTNETLWHYYYAPDNGAGAPDATQKVSLVALASATEAATGGAVSNEVSGLPADTAGLWLGVSAQNDGGETSITWASAAITTPALPTATIDAPLDGQRQSEGSGWFLRGTATAAIVYAWTSDVDGSLGTAVDLDDVALSGTDASPVAHTLTLTASNTYGDSAAVSVAVTAGIAAARGFDIARFKIRLLGGIY